MYNSFTMKFELLAPCHFGLESVLKKEITDLGYDILQVEDGRVTFCCDEEGIPRSNIFLRTCERVYLKVGSFHAETSMNCLKEQKPLTGNSIFRKTADSGSGKPVPSSQSCSAHPISRASSKRL